MKIARTLRKPAALASLERVGSLRLTLWLIALFAIAVAASYQGISQPSWALAAPLALLAANLAAAVATHPTFRRQSALLVFHLALIAIIGLVAAGRLTYLKGNLELSDGQTFEGVLAQRENGPLHRDALERVAFTNLGFSVQYEAGVRRAGTLNRVRWRDAHGEWRSAEIGDNAPLVIEGYRFYTTFNKGFAPQFGWSARGSTEETRGTIHLPSYPLNQLQQALEWTPPGATRSLWTMLDIGEVLLDPDQRVTLRVPREHKLVIRTAGLRVELRPGESHAFAEGTLRYEGLRMWMGYTVFYDWTIPWLLAACVVAVLALAWHFGAKFLTQPWQGRDAETAT